MNVVYLLLIMLSIQRFLLTDACNNYPVMSGLPIFIDELKRMAKAEKKGQDQDQSA